MLFALLQFAFRKEGFPVQEVLHQSVNQNSSNIHHYGPNADDRPVMKDVSTTCLLHSLTAVTART